LLAETHPDLVVLIGGQGRQAKQLHALIQRSGARARLLGRLTDAEVVQLYQAIDVMAMPCQRRWWGLEQEGFGIVFLEAAACGVPQIAGRSGGAAEAVQHGVTGLVVEEPDRVEAVAGAVAQLLDDPERRRCMGDAARARVEASFGYDHLAATLRDALDSIPPQGSPLS
ncbi:MAG: glycosyltransferase family 4 protein, partial [Actinomycetota bacterium]|nr:glycosyltransferase family 4 protein [Actinomycetota bacterium]